MPSSHGTRLLDVRRIIAGDVLDNEINLVPVEKLLGHASGKRRLAMIAVGK